MASDSETMRAEFEAWLRSRWSSDRVTDRDADGSYVYAGADGEWDAWQAAWSRAPSAEAKDAAELETIEHWLRMAAEPVGVECCGQGDPEYGCCGNAVSVFLEPHEVFSAMSKRHAELVAAIAQQGAAAAQDGEVGRG